MAENSESGSELAWRVLATLEVGSLVAATTAVLVHLARSRMRSEPLSSIPQKVLIPNCETRGKEIANHLLTSGCDVVTLASDATSGADCFVDALIIVGAEHKPHLDGLCDLVSAEVYTNLNLLDSLSSRVKPGGKIVWVYDGTERSQDVYMGARRALVQVIKCQLQLIANRLQCKYYLISNCPSIEETIVQVCKALNLHQSVETSRFSLRNISLKVRKYLGRWLKSVS